MSFIKLTYNKKKIIRFNSVMKCNAHFLKPFLGLGLEYLTNKSYFLIERLRADTNYSFYIRVYTMKSASDHSKNITCRTKLQGERKMYFKAKSSTILEIEWDTLSSDIPCGSSYPQYKLQWRRLGLLSNNVVSVNTNYSIIRGIYFEKNTEHNTILYIFRSNSFRNI